MRETRSSPTTGFCLFAVVCFSQFSEHRYSKTHVKESGGGGGRGGNLVCEAASATQDSGRIKPVPTRAATRSPPKEPEKSKAPKPSHIPAKTKSLGAGSKREARQPWVLVKTPDASDVKPPPRRWPLASAARLRALSTSGILSLTFSTVGRTQTRASFSSYIKKGRKRQHALGLPTTSWVWFVAYPTPAATRHPKSYPLRGGGRSRGGIFSGTPQASGRRSGAPGLQVSAIVNCSFRG